MPGILVGIDFSERMERILKFAIEEARVRGESIILLYCIEFPTSINPAVRPIVTKEVMKNAIKAEGVLMEKFSVIVEKEGVKCEKLIVTKSENPGKCILEVAEKYDVSLIVIGVRKHSPVGKLLFGSTAQYVLMNSRKPVACVN
ncbi:MAG: universal stress protein [Archaeoglobaceae archaeon]